MSIQSMDSMEAYRKIEEEENKKSVDKFKTSKLIKEKPLNLLLFTVLNGKTPEKMYSDNIKSSEKYFKDSEIQRFMEEYEAIPTKQKQIKKTKEIIFSDIDPFTGEKVASKSLLKTIKSLANLNK